MPTRSDWITCQDCEEEFSVLSSNHNGPEYCPFCSSPLDLFDEDLDEEE